MLCLFTLKILLRGWSGLKADTKDFSQEENPYLNMDDSKEIEMIVMESANNSM